MRADARRNRERIVQAARELFAVKGLAVSIDQIADHAKVGVGTLYRHFPDKNALFEAIVLDRLEASVEDARVAAGLKEPGEAFFACLARLVDEAATRKDLLDALVSSDVDVQFVTAEVSGQLRDAIAQLLLSAQRAGAVRNDISIDEVMIVLGGACFSFGLHGSDEEERRKVWGVMSDGLRTRRS
jgi:AcrR family transcriptional regulator